MKKGASVSGTFSGMAAWGMAGASAVEQTAQNTKKTAQNTAILIDLMAVKNGPKFA